MKRNKLQALLLALSLGPPALALAQDEPQEKEPDVIFVPTPDDVVAEMLKMARVTREDVLYDLGCGDCRIPIAAARCCGCRACGFDIDPQRIRESLANIEKNAAGKLVRVEKRDIFQLDLRPASVITLYLLPELNVRLVPQLSRLRAGSRIVSHDFDMAGWRPEKILHLRSQEDGIIHSVYFWKTPLVPHPADDALDPEDFKEACDPAAERVDPSVLQDLIALSELKSGELLVDLGCRDERLPLEVLRIAGTRVRAFGAVPDRLAILRTTLEKDPSGLAPRLQLGGFEPGKLDLSGASVVVLDVSAEDLAKIRPLLAKLKPGTRILSHGLPIEEVEPERTLCTFARVGGSRHVLYRWKVPSAQEK